MTVYALIHDDRDHDMGDVRLRGIFSTQEKAAAVLVTRTPSGAKSRAWGAHDEYCCSVEEYELDDLTYGESVKEDDPPPTQGERLIPDWLLRDMLDSALKPNPYR